MLQSVNQNIKKMITQYWLDLFCGAGGTSQGLHTAKNKLGESVAEVLACINHDPKAIQSHAANFPNCHHSIEDIRTAHLAPIQRIFNNASILNPEAALCMWASLELVRIFQIKMRMLKVSELKLITGFPADYVLNGSQADQKKFIGNAVPPPIAKALSEALHVAILSQSKLKVAA